MFKKILIPIDTADSAQKSVEVAKTIAENYGSEIVLLHVFSAHITNSVFEGAPRSLPDKSELFQVALKILSEIKIPIKTHIETGDPSIKIVSFADQEKVDLIVMGNRGLSGISQLFLDSVSEQVVHQAHCAVLVVK